MATASRRLETCEVEVTQPYHWEPEMCNGSIEVNCSCCGDGYCERHADDNLTTCKQCEERFCDECKRQHDCEAA